MLTWSPNFGRDKSPSILCVGAHCDDIEIGCGGLLLQLATRYSNADFRCVVLSSTPEREAETQQALGRLLTNAANVKVDVLAHKNSYFPYQGKEIKDSFESLKSDFSPDLILTHFRNDRHQDHRVISDLTWSTFRDHSVLEYEIPKYDGDLGRPNVFVPLTENTVEQKIRCLIECFPSQSSRAWFTDETFLSLLRLRGIECNSQSGYAEAFFSRKLTAAM